MFSKGRCIINDYRDNMDMPTLLSIPFLRNHNESAFPISPPQPTIPISILIFERASLNTGTTSTYLREIMTTTILNLKID
jgi:hypothetical protein